MAHVSCRPPPAAAKQIPVAAASQIPQDPPPPAAAPAAAAGCTRCAAAAAAGVGCRHPLRHLPARQIRHPGEPPPSHRHQPAAHNRDRKAVASHIG